VGRRIRKVTLVTLMVLAAAVSPIAVPIRIVVLHLRRDTARTEFVARDERQGHELPQTT
jgi:hypothetical protein